MNYNLEDASILYLDDVEEYLDGTKTFFEGQGCKTMTFTDSIDMAKNMAIGNEVDIFMCDLKLEQISKTEKGNEILLEVRQKNPNVFLALYTAWNKDLNQNERKNLTNNDIALYSKADDELMIHNLISDYKEFKQSNLKKIEEEMVPTDSDLTNTMKIEILRHLNGVSNQSLIVPVMGDKDVPLYQLIIEVDNLTPLGRRFISDWIKTDSIIRRIKN